MSVTRSKSNEVCWAAARAGALAPASSTQHARMKHRTVRIVSLPFVRERKERIVARRASRRNAASRADTPRRNAAWRADTPAGP